jgi:hypothetical protein
MAHQPHFNEQMEAIFPLDPQPFEIFGNVITTAPELDSILLLGSGLLGLAGVRRRPISK